MAQRSSISAPYGDIVYVSTPAIDKWGQQLYTEQKMREARAQQESVALDANIQKELGKVRSIDTPEVINSYQQYKQLSKELMFNNALRKNPLAFNQAKQAQARAYQNIFSVANKSSELNDMQKNLTSGYMKDPNSHADDFGSRMNTLMNTPVSQLGQPHPQYGDLTNMEGYLDRGINTDFGKMIRDAVGQERTIYGKPEKLEGGLQVKTPAFKYANTPLQVKDYLIGAMSMRQAGKDAAKSWDRLPEQEIDNVIKQYQALPADYWNKMGLSEPQDLFPKNPDNKAENYAAYLSMKDAISRAPREDKPLITQDLRAVKDLDFARQKEMQAIKNADARGLIELKKKLDPNDTEMQNVWYQAHLDGLIKEAKENKDPKNRHHVYTTKGRSLYYYNMIKPDQFTMKAFARNGREPDRIGVTDKGEIVPIFFKYDEKNEKITTEKNGKGSPIVDEEDSQPMSYNQALINLGYRGATKKQLASDLKGKIKSPSTDNDPFGIFD